MHAYIHRIIFCSKNNNKKKGYDGRQDKYIRQIRRHAQKREIPISVYFKKKKAHVHRFFPIR